MSTSCRRLNHAPLLALACFWVFLGAAFAQNITGTVTNATTGKPSAGDDVTLLSLARGMEEVGSAKTDIQKTQTDLAATNAKLARAMGDLGVQSGLIAHNASELEILKRKGERNYYDFTLQKNARTPVSTVSLQLKKVDPKKNKFTLNVIADDKTIEKKDRTVSEPLQFYTGRDHMLYEVVVFTASKDKVTGYLSTPKNAPTPVTP